jgi:AcrR family transcriptional regulator
MLAARPKHKRHRDRIVLAALTQASAGYDGVQIRAVADAAGVATSTVYLYFPSKDDLLVSCLHRWLLEFAERCVPDAEVSGDPYRRLLAQADILTTSLCTDPRLADALTRALLYTGGNAAERADLVRLEIVQMFAATLSDILSEMRRRQIAEMTTDVWLTNVLAIAQNRSTTADLRLRLQHMVAAIRTHDPDST